MGICVALQTEDGRNIEFISDDKNLLHNLLPPPRTEDSMLGWIDWYGSTLYNHLQMPRFLLEWNGLSARTLIVEESGLVEAVRLLAERCQKEETSYLKFIGD